MNLKLTRLTYDSFGILGILQDEAGNEICKTLEHAFSMGDRNLAEQSMFDAKVAEGTYTCLRHAPNRLPYETWELQNVPPFQGNPVTAILIHIGNYNRDSDGCILVGRRVVPDPDAPSENMITSSKNTFNKLMDLTRDLDSFTLTIEG